MHTWIVVMIPAIVGTFMIAFMNLGKRYLLKDKKMSALQYLVVSFGTMTAIFGIIYVAMWGFNYPEVLPGFWVAVAGTTIANIFIQFFNAKAASIDQGEVSLTAPIQAMTPGLITVLATILGEFPSWVGIAGVFCMAIGSYVLLWPKPKKDEKLKWYEYFGPFQKVAMWTRFHKLTPEERGKTIVVTLAFASACCGTVGLLFDGLFTRRGVDLQGLCLGIMVLTAVLTGSYFVQLLIRPDTTPEQKKNGFYVCFKRYYPLVFLVVAGAWVAHVFLINPTYHHTYVAYIGTLKRFAILASVVLGFLFFKEQDFKKRFLAALLVIVGVILISMDDLPSRISTQMVILGF